MLMYNTGGDIIFWATGAAGMTLKATSGNLGIGGSPNLRLTVADSGSVITSGTVTFASQAKGIEIFNNVSGTTDNLIGCWFSTGPHKAGIASGRTNAASTWGVDLRFFVHGPEIANLDQTYEKMRLLDTGALCIGTPTAYGTNLLNVNGSIYSTGNMAAVVADNSDLFTFISTNASYTKSCFVGSVAVAGSTSSYYFYGQQSTSVVALKIFTNGNIQNTNNSYGAISDARLKENIKDATPKLDDLMKVKVRNYNIKGESNKQLGVISQELEAIFPNMIEESTNIGEDMKIKGVKYSVFVPMLIKAVQEQQAQINELKSQLINK